MEQEEQGERASQIELTSYTDICGKRTDKGSTTEQISFGIVPNRWFYSITHSY